jgi:hypothetical protein
MTLEQIFKIANLIAVIGWVIMAIFYNHRLTSKIIFSGIVMLFSILYVYLILTSMDAFKDGGFGSLPEVTALFSNQKVLLAGWVHYLAFDLMIGLFITLNSSKQGINRFIILPCLFLTLCSGLLVCCFIILYYARNNKPLFLQYFKR